MRQVDAGSSLAEAATVESELLVRSGGTVSSVYLSAVNERVKKLENWIGKAAEKKKSVVVGYEEVREIVAKREQLGEFTYPLECEVGEETVLVGSTDTMKPCRRCGVNFVPSKYYCQQETGSTGVCRYHGGKTEKIGGLRVYGCCHAPIGDSQGCETKEWHVFEGYGKNDAVPRFPPLQSDFGGRNVVALDAEMSHTVGGYEVSRLTVIDFFTESTLMDVLIEARHGPVLDYNTKWSGVSAESFVSGQFPVLSFAEAKKQLSEFIGKETILIGHSLDNDLRVLEVNNNENFCCLLFL